MLVVIRLTRSVDTHGGGEFDRPDGDAASTGTVLGTGPPFISSIIEMLIVSSPSRPSEEALAPSGNCNGNTPIPIKFDRWIRSYDSAITAFTPSNAVPFAAQSRLDPIHTLARHDDQRNVLLGVGRCRVEYRDHHVVTLREVDGEATLDSVEHQILQANVRERAANHYFVVASPRTVGVEVRAFDAVLAKVRACWAVGLDRTGR